MPRRRSRRRHTVSKDLKARIPALHHDGYRIQQICDILAVKKSLVHKTLANYSVVSNPRKFSRVNSRARILSQADLKFLQVAIDRYHTLDLDELQQELFSKRGVHASISTLTRAIKRFNDTQEVVTAPALERNEMIRARYMNLIGAEARDANMVLFIDGPLRKSSATMGRAGKGTPCIQRQHFIRGTRYTILPVLSLDGVIAYDIIEGTVTGERFVQFLKDYVMPFTTPYPGPRSVLIMNDCSARDGESVRKLVEDMNLCKLIFLPPNSPDYNPIEHAFSDIKAYMCRYHEDNSFMGVVRACQSITPDHAAGYFRASGYI